MNAVGCAGRKVDDRLQPYGPPCGRKFTDIFTADSMADAARAAGWSIGPDGQAMCPGCRRPAPEVVALVREVAR